MKLFIVLSIITFTGFAIICSRDYIMSIGLLLWILPLHIANLIGEKDRKKNNYEV
jgi:hypothetical protein